MTREGSARQRSERAVAIDTAVDLCAPSITAVLDNIRELTIRTQATRFLLGLTGHCSAAYLIPAFPNKTTVICSTSGNTAASAGGYAAALSVVTVCGVTPVLSKAERKKAVAASVSRGARKRT